MDQFSRFYHGLREISTKTKENTGMTSLKLLLMMCQRGSELLLQAKRANARTDSAVIASKYNDDYRIFAAEP